MASHIIVCIQDSAGFIATAVPTDGSDPKVSVSSTQSAEDAVSGCLKALEFKLEYDRLMN